MNPFASALCGLVSLALVACSSVTPPVLTDCTVPGVARRARCGVVRVPENRAIRGGRTIDLHVAVVQATAATRRPDPLVALAGGPGQSAGAVAPLFVPELEGLLGERDLVLVDQRGTGQSNPLTCGGGFELLDPARRAALSDCARELGTRADLSQYTTGAAVDDLRDVLDALGYARVNLVAGSYGTRPAMVFMQRYPRRVRTAVLRAVAPPGFNIIVDATATATTQLHDVARRCRADAACAAAYANVDADLAEVRRRLRASPVRLTAVNPATRVAEELEVTDMLFQQTMYALLLNTAARQALPRVVHAAASGDFTVIAPVMLQIRSTVFGTLPIGMYLSVVCAEDAPFITPGDRERTAGDFDSFALVADACSVWPRGTAAPELRRPAKIGVPALLVSGEADPAMSPSAAAEAMRYLARGRHVVAAATAHVPMFPACIHSAVEQFVNAGDASGIDVACAGSLPWPPFVAP